MGAGERLALSPSIKTRSEKRRDLLIIVLLNPPSRFQPFSWDQAGGISFASCLAFIGLGDSVAVKSDGKRFRQPLDLGRIGNYFLGDRVKGCAIQDPIELHYDISLLN